MDCRVGDFGGVFDSVPYEMVEVFVNLADFVNSERDAVIDSNDCVGKIEEERDVEALSETDNV